MCLLGGARRCEPAKIEWQRHVLADRIVFDPETTKMGRGHAVPRTPLVDGVLARVREGGEREKEDERGLLHGRLRRTVL